ncbi:MAG: hypothetical protein NUV80_01480 [Candidatus Berkelbacteria bacterium]|nr:hypothetical protein [Candidatus Berkelbacteria bacterium]MCR4307213.1 hypothetical protein [Candidatus Berkelbacteria bacterium]
MNELYSIIGGWVVAFFFTAIVTGVAILLWLSWFSPAVTMVLAAITAMAWFVRTSRS